MAVDMPATRTIGIPAPKPAATKVVLGFVLLEDEVEATDWGEVVMLGIEASPSVAAGVEVLVAPSMVVYVEREMENPRS
jgi:hypothetical protein